MKDSKFDNQQDFIVNKELLVDNMKYFERYIKKEVKDINKRLKVLDELDITVQCSPNIFKWILDYLNKDEENKPKLTPSEVIPVLISADSLMISKLVEK